MFVLCLYVYDVCVSLSSWAAVHSDRLLLLKKNGDGVSDTQGTLGIFGNRVPDSLEKKQQVAIPSVVFFADLHGFVQQHPPLATNCTIQVSTTSRVS